MSATREQPPVGALAESSICDWCKQDMADPDTRTCTLATYLFGQLREIVATRPLQLVCWCSPKECHADIIAARLRASLSEGGDGETD